jgi:hypothetical protein
VDLFIIRPDEIPPGLGLLEIDKKVIDFVKTHEQQRMKDYLANLDAHNLRFAPPLPNPGCVSLLGAGSKETPCVGY